MRTLLTILAPLAALWFVIDHFGIESRAFSNLVLLTIAGLPLHYFLPLRFRLPFFAALSLVAIVLVLGPRQAAWLIGLGLALIAMCHLPIRFRARVALVVLAGTLLAAVRGGWATSPVALPAAIWPILGSMFMFRLAAYLYDVRHEPGLGGFWPSLSYFFLLPNVCFPLFPVVDYKTFRRHYYNADRRVIYHGGLHWIFRGVLQLLLYRLVYQTLVIDPAAVENAADLGQYFIWPFLLYLRVSGQFHVIVGLLRLFGFNLPETHHEYFLASSFNDFWRRINIYWKDFMMKLFYYPSFFALRSKGTTLAVLLSTLVVFFVTWLLHTYQWFWLRGSYFLAWNDALFWGVLGAVVVVNSLYEWRYGRARALVARTLGWPQAIGLALRTVGVFCFIALLWSLWSTESLTTWLALWPAAARWPDQWSPGALAALAIPLAIGIVVIAKARAWVPAARPSVEMSGAIMVGVSVCLVAASSYRVSAYLGPLGSAMTALRVAGLNQADAVALERGYYENLMGVDRFNGDLWALYMNRPLDWGVGILEDGLGRPADGFVPYELLPSIDARFKGAPFRTNQWGMHDKDYSKAAPPGCARIALLGASHTMGSGVDRDQTFDAQLEDRWNREHPGRCLEILNFAVYGYSPIHQLDVLENTVLAFSPTALLYVGHPEDSQRVVRRLAGMVRDGSPLPFDYLRTIVGDAGVSADQSERVVAQRLAPFGERILSELYDRMIAIAARHDLCAGFVYLPMVPDMKYAVDVEREKRLATGAGFTLFDLSDVYRVPDRNALWIAEWDAHPNARGHELIASRLGALFDQDGSIVDCRIR